MVMTGETKAAAPQTSTDGMQGTKACTRISDSHGPPGLAVIYWLHNGIVHEIPPTAGSTSGRHLRPSAVSGARPAHAPLHYSVGQRGHGIPRPAS